MAEHIASNLDLLQQMQRTLSQDCSIAEVGLRLENVLNVIERLDADLLNIPDSVAAKGYDVRNVPGVVWQRLRTRLSTQIGAIPSKKARYNR
jgi:hypothetical protein